MGQVFAKAGMVNRLRQLESGSALDLAA